MKNLFLLGLGAFLGVASNFIMSNIVSVDQYGRFVTLTANASFVSVLACLGLNAYFLYNNQDKLAKNKNLLMIPAIVAAIFFGLIIFDDVGFVNSSFVLFAVVLTINFMQILNLQLKRDHTGIVYIQIISPGVKFLCSCAVLFLGIKSNFDGIEIYSSVLLVASAIIILFFLARVGSIDGIFKSFNFFDGIEFLTLTKYYLSSVLSVSYNMAAPYFIAKFMGYKYVAYYGVYIIFWSMNSVLLNYFINNKMTSSYASARSDFDRALVYGDYKEKVFYIAVGSLVAPSVFYILFKRNMWVQYGDLTYFIILAGAALFFRSYASIFGVCLNRSSGISLKIVSQIITFFWMIFLFCFLRKDDVIFFGMSIFSIEFLLFASYFSAKSALKTSEC